MIESKNFIPIEGSEENSGALSYETPEQLKRLYWLKFQAIRDMLMGGGHTKGTAPKMKTVHRLMKQAALKLPVNGKRIKLEDGRVLHPTKGVRKGRAA